MKKIFFLLCCILLFISYFLASGTAGEIIGEVEIRGLYSIEKKEFLDLLCLKPGKPIDSTAIREGIKRAFLKGIFEDICIRRADGEKVKVTIDVKERDFIETIYIKGKYILSKKTIKDSFLLKEGQVMRYDMIGKAMEELKQEMSIRGFPRADVDIKVERLKKPYRVNIFLRVNAGEEERIEDIRILDSTEEITSLMKLSRGDRFDRIRLKRDMGGGIKEYYKKKGFFKPVVTYGFEKGILTVSINPGKRLVISIKGNSAISEKNLLKEMPFFEVEDFRDDIVEEAVYKIVTLYHKEGYAFAQIAPVISQKNGVIDLNFFIFEGERVKIRKISFEGLSLPEGNLKGIMSLKEGGLYNPDLLDVDREAIEKFYNALGYLAAKVEDFQTKHEEGTKEIDISVKIQEGQRTLIGKIYITGIQSISEEEVRKAIRLRSGDPYNEIDISDARYRVMDLYKARGFSDIRVSIERDFEGQEASLTFRIEEGSVTFLEKPSLPEMPRRNMK
ncbi:MAG: POTRA domain-containing protein [Nitrospirota bacterium]